MSDVGVVSTVVAPSLKDVSQSDLVKFEIEYEAYKKRIDGINRTRDTEREIVAASIRECMDPVLLHCLCIAGQIQGAKELSEATDEKVKAWFDERLAEAPEDMTARVRSALDSVKYVTNKKDPSGGVLSFFLKVIAALDKNNASSMVSDKETCKALVTKIIAKLEPAELKERLFEARECWTAEQRSDLQFVLRRMREIAEEVAQGAMVRDRIQRKKSWKTPGKDKDSTGRANKRKRDNDDGDAIHGDNRGDKKKMKRVWDKKCLNPDCSELHKVSDCKNTSPEKRRHLLSEHRANLRKDRKERRMKRVQALRPANESNANPMNPADAAEGRYDVLFEEKVHSIALGDYGSDESAISKETLDNLVKAECTIDVITLATPLILKNAVSSNVQDQTQFTASKTVSLTVKIVMQGTNLPVRIRDVPFVVVDQELDETILGRPFLKRIGFDLERHLQDVGRHVDGCSFKELGQICLKSSKLYQGVRYNSIEDDPVPHIESVGASMGLDTKEEMDAAFRDMLRQAKYNGMSEAGVSNLAQMFQEHRDVFRIKLGPDPPARLPPLSIKLKKDARPFRAPQRRYAAPQREFIVATIKKLEKLGAVVKNPGARWASPALAVPKPGSEGFRFTVDLRGANAETDPIVSSMPHMGSMIHTVEGSDSFSKVDMAHAYWQVPLEESSQELMSIQTPIGLYSSTRLLQGSTDSGNHFQAVTSEVFAELVDQMLQWLDDFLLHARGEQNLLKVIRVFLDICATYGLKINARKTIWFLREATFCGRILSADGMKFDPRRFDALLNMKTPTMGGELQQLLCASNWMRSSIPSYAKVVAPLHKLMEQVYEKKGSRTKRAIAKVQLQDIWTEEHDRSFTEIRDQLAAATKLAFPKEGLDMCLFTDASESHWSAILTQVPDSQRKRPINEQEHVPLSFLSGAFTGSAEGWSVPEKEGFAIVESMCRSDYLIALKTVSIYTDHANLAYIYDPYGHNPGVARHTANKLMRWALKLTSFRYVIEHIAGEDNVWADMFSRWAVRPEKKILAIRVNTLLLAPITPHLDDSMDWPTMKCIIDEQKKAKQTWPSRFKLQDGIVRDKNDVYWIPDPATSLKFRIMIAGHTGMSGHRGYTTTQQSIKKHFWWTSIDGDVEVFVKSCLHCLCSETGEIVSRPMGHALHADKPNALIHFDYCYIMQGEKHMQYVLVIKDDFSGYVWLTAVAEANAKNTADALIRWFAAFGIVIQWVSDRGSHFKNEVVACLREQTNGAHHFTLAYCPWSNGTVEVVCRELLRALRALLSEFQFPHRSWPLLLPVVQSVLNSTKLPRLGGRCPLTVFTGLPADSPLLTIKQTVHKTVQVKSLDEARALQKIEAGLIHKALDQMHREVHEKVTAKRAKEIQRHNAKTSVRPVNFTTGDYVLTGVIRKDRGKKTEVRWRGPHRVVSCLSDYIFEVEDLLSGAKRTVHGRRLKMFRNKDFEVTEEVKNHLAYQQNELLVVREFQDIRRNEGQVELLTAWRGFDDVENSWVSLDTMQEDVPVLVEEYIVQLMKSGTQRQRSVAGTV